ncbi:MAG: DUF4838 domain-containing protein [Planctomycetes bacterium]|nr:DUF4838 domain-containing protein [Planctomycetota bacterium]
MHHALAIALAALLPPPQEPGPARAAHAIVEHGRSAYRIVIPAPATPPMEFAAAELRALLAEMSGVELPIATEDLAPDGPAILLGPSARARASGAMDRARELGEDGVLVRSVGEDLLLLGGGERGSVYVVYEFLERFLGCRFLASDCVVVPKRERIALPPLDHANAPPFVYREVLSFLSGDGVLVARQRLNGGNTNQCLGRPHGTGEKVGGFVIGPFCPSAETMVPAGIWLPEHPEWFGLVGGKRHGASIGGQLCYANPELLAHCTKWVLDWCAAHPEIPCIDVSQNDAYPGSSGACECEACMAIVREEGSQHGPILRFANAIATAVAERFPGKTIETIAYQHTLATPKVTKPRDDVIVRLCQHACYFHGIDCPSLGAEFREALAQWRRSAKNVFVWHYGVNFWSYLAPNPNLGALAADLKRYARDGINGVMVQCDLQSPGGELAELRQYLCAQLLWDPSRDPLAIRQDFCAGYYGPAADDVLEFLAAMDRWAVAMPQHIPMNGWDPAAVTPPDFVTAGLDTLGRALEKASDPGHRNRVEKLMLPLWYLRLQWPDRYGLSKSDGAALLARFRRVVEANAITTISEGPPNAAGFLAQMQAQFGG